MTKSKHFSGARGLRALAIASLFIAVSSLGIGSALAEKKGNTELDDSAKAVGNNFGDMLKGMGQEVGKVIGSENKSAEKEKTKEKKKADDKSDKDEKSKK
jgi:hypothetical protein